MYKKKEHIHFVGVGGIGMSGIAKILFLQGYNVSGCDINTNKNTLELQKLGCQISEGHNQQICKDKIDILVYSSAVTNHTEIKEAEKNGTTIVHRSEMLAEILRKKFNISVTGSHGKTTTTSLISHILIESGIDPTVVSGGILKKHNTQAMLGKSDISVAEADESDRSLLNLPTSIGVITNISLEHLETYKDLDDIKNTFLQFLNNIAFFGKAIVCIDDQNIQSIITNTNIKTLKYGLSNEAEVTAKNIKLYPECSKYELWIKNKMLANIELTIPGKHNVLNSLAAISAALELEIPIETIAKNIKTFTGVERRFEYHGKFNGAEVFDDYAHHPNEIEQTLKVAKKRTNGKVFIIFQSHRFSRTKMLWNQFVEVFKQSEIFNLVITDIFSANEAPLPGTTGQELAQAIKNASTNIHVKYLPIDEEFCSIVEHLESEVKPGDLILFLGAGKLDKAAEFIAKDHKSLKPNKANNQLNH
jgi:UDP-N-acetylmuramate--alanine ligase